MDPCHSLECKCPSFTLALDSILDMSSVGDVRVDVIAVDTVPRSESTEITLKKFMWECYSREKVNVLQRMVRRDEGRTYTMVCLWAKVALEFIHIILKLKTRYNSS